jgi:hypothetical protein
MISTLIFILGLVIAGFIAFTTRDKMYRVERDTYYNRDVNKFNPVWIFKPIGVFILSLIIASVQPFAIEKVDAGNKGLKVNLIGNQRGVSSYQYKTTNQLF